MDEKQSLSRLQRLCSKAEYCRADVRRKALKDLEGEADAADRVVASLVKEGYVDDVRYASAFAREKASIQGWGPIKIRFQLRAKGISEADIASALEEIEPVPGMDVEISVPEGEALAAKTFNPRLGIVGGISILGTSGIVEPMSEEALIDSIRLEIRQRKALGDERLILAPGNYGTDFLRDTFGVGEDRIVKVSNFIGRALDAAAEAGFSKVLLAGHIGKLIKLSGGIMNTHSREGDGRAELMAACALRAGCDADTARTILACVTTDEMLRILREKGLLAPAMELMARGIDLYVNARVKGLLTVGVLVFSDGSGPLCATAAAKRWVETSLKAKEKEL